MQETIEQFNHYFKNLWDNRWFALTIAGIFSIIGWVVVITAPDRFEVTTNVYVDTRSMLRPLLKGIAVESDVTNAAAKVMQRTLLSRPNLETVVKQTGLASQIATPEAYDKFIAHLEEKIIIGGGREFDNVYTIKYEHSDPVTAKNVVQALLDLFIEKVVGANRLDTDVTKRFLDEKIKEYEIRLTEAEERLKEFKKEHPGVLISDDRTYFNKLEMMKSQLQTARLELQESEYRRNALSEQLKSTPSYTGGGKLSASGKSLIDQKLLEAKATLAELQLKFTEIHPDVSAAKRMVAQLEEQKKSGVSGGETATSAERIPASVNPIYHEMKISLGEEEAKIAALKARVQEYEKRFAELEADVDTLPDIEAKLAKLDRDYLVNKREYEDLLERRESADISEGVINADKLQFEVLEPPRVPLSPTGPNRIKWITMVFLLALAAGVGSAIFISQIRPIIYNRQTLKQITTLPVLGSVSKLNSVGSHLAKGAGNISYSIFAGVLLLSYAALMFSYLLNADYLKQYVGFNYSEHVEQQIGEDVITPVKKAMEQM